MMVEQEMAPNLTAVCTCGRFIVAKGRKAGKKVKCAMCGRRVVLPKPVEKEGRREPTRISPRALEKQLKRARGRSKKRRSTSTGAAKAVGRHAAQRFSLKPGQEVCTNPDCRLPLPAGSNVCPRCKQNIISGVRYESPGPENDPTGRWKLKWVKG